MEKIRLRETSAIRQNELPTHLRYNLTQSEQRLRELKAELTQWQHTQRTLDAEVNTITRARALAEEPHSNTPFCKLAERQLLELSISEMNIMQLTRKVSRAEEDYLQYYQAAQVYLLAAEAEDPVPLLLSK